MARPKGSPNKVTKAGREAIEHVFNRLGGAQGLFDWTQRDAQNEREFYSKIWPRIIPQQLQAELSHNVNLPDFLADYWRRRTDRSVG